MDGASCSRENSSSMNLSETNGNNRGENTSTNDGEEEEDDDPSSSSSSSSSTSSSASSTSTVVHLDNFRHQWQRELENPSRASIAKKRNTNHENEAREMYLKGVEAERKGQLYDAIRYYRRAVQLVPDIEFRVADFIPKATKLNVEDIDSDAYIYDDSDGYEEEEEDCNRCEGEVDDENLESRFARLCGWDGKICRPLYDQQTSHVSVLPSEILIYIFKWVVSSELDMKSLEQLSTVCRGFYLCARDMELWRLACYKVWGVNCGSYNMYGSWREMYILRPRLRFNGVYISKTTYYRPGEAAFQDLSYRPWHVVDYYRYLRFFPGGIVLMMTTPNEPIVSLSKLKQRNARHQAILSGHYRIHGNTVTAIMKRTKMAETIQPSPYLYRRGRQIQYQDMGEQTFHLELEITAYKNRLNYKLEWRHYSTHTVYRNGQESVSDFELSQTKFPPLWFSGVRSYSSYSDIPLR